MIEHIGGVTSQLIGVALDAMSLRHEVIANNIANVDTPGYQTKRLNFDSYLDNISASLQTDFLHGGVFTQSSQTQLTDDIADLKEALRQGDNLLEAQGEAVQLDSEMVRLSENTLRYQALLNAASLRGEFVKMAIKEGKQ